MMCSPIVTGRTVRLHTPVHDGAVDEQQRWARVLTLAVEAIGPGRRTVRVDGHGYVEGFADRLAAALRDAGAGHEGAAVVTDGPADVLVWLRASSPYAPRTSEPDAQIVVDVHEADWPVIRHIDPSLVGRDRWHASETAAFFAARAATWDTRFGDDLPAYRWAVQALGIAPGAVAVDVGCGTGRALPSLRAAVGPAGTVIGIDLTERMLEAAAGLGRDRDAALVLADARDLPLRDGATDVVFAAGLVHHLPDADAALTELARVTRPGGQLALFHPTGRAALAARHGRTLRPDELLAEPVLRAALQRTGWSPQVYDDAPDHFFARAIRSTL
jgi:SAM-dependent methyltransferase